MNANQINEKKFAEKKNYKVLPKKRALSNTQDLKNHGGLASGSHTFLIFCNQQ